MALLRQISCPSKIFQREFAHNFMKWELLKKRNVVPKKKCISVDPRNTKILRLNLVQPLSTRQCSDGLDDLKVKHYGKKKPHPETPKYGEYQENPPKGRVHDQKPFRMELIADKRYSWCTCGYSKNQPFCDGSHKSLVRDKQVSVHFHPHRFKVEETKDYWLCNCKQTENRPFCDGSHKALVKAKNQ